MTIRNEVILLHTIFNNKIIMYFFIKRLELVIIIVVKAEIDSQALIIIVNIISWVK